MINIFIGTSPNGEDAVQEKIVEYSINKFITEPYKITWMRNNNDPSNFFASCNSRAWATPFSAYRWFVAEACDFKGKAIYMDVDMLVLADLKELWNFDMQGKAFATRPGGRTCVMLIDCEKAKGITPPVEKMKKDYAVAKRMFAIAKSNMSNFGRQWNCLDGESLPLEKIKILHFTQMSSQPWKPSWYKGKHSAHRRPEVVALWNQYKNEAHDSSVSR